MTTTAVKMITAAQRCKIFAIAKQRGKSTDDIRAMTPAGSISMLTCVQAAVLIDALEQGKSPDYDKVPRVPASKRKRRPKGVFAIARDEQRKKIYALANEIGFDGDDLDEWLSKRHFADKRPMDCVLNPAAAVSSNDMNAVIELLKHVLRKKTAFDKRCK